MSAHINMHSSALLQYLHSCDRGGAFIAGDTAYCRHEDFVKVVFVHEIIFLHCVPTCEWCGGS